MLNTILGFFQHYKTLLIVIVIFWTFWTFGLGFLGGWLSRKGKLGAFPRFFKGQRILIFAPHIDDENIGAGGLIQRALSAGAEVKVVYFTNGDDNIISILEENKKIDQTPSEYIALGQQRMEEGIKAMAVLGLQKESLIFLGYPDRGLTPMLNQNYLANNPVISKGTKFDHNPYRGTFKQSQVYCGENLASDLREIIAGFKPETIIVSHPRDKHPDHSATFEFVQGVIGSYSHNYKIYTYLVHFPNFPLIKKLKINDFLYPPKKLFSQEGWLSLEITKQEEYKKLQAMREYKTQELPVKNLGLIDSLVKTNEIFEEY